MSAAGNPQDYYKRQVEAETEKHRQHAAWLQYANQQNHWNHSRGLGNIYGRAYQQQDIQQAYTALQQANLMPTPAVMPSVEADEFRWLRQRVREIEWRP